MNRAPVKLQSVQSSSVETRGKDCAMDGLRLYHNASDCNSNAAAVANNNPIDPASRQNLANGKSVLNNNGATTINLVWNQCHQQLQRFDLVMSLPPQAEVGMHPENDFSALTLF